MAATLKYTVKKGDTLTRIAQAHHILDWKKEIWAAGFNKELRAKTKSPDKLQPGWVVVIPVIKMPAGQIYGPVGAGNSLNRPEDVQTVKVMLNKHAAQAGFKSLSVNGKADGSFIDAIKKFQTASDLKASGKIDPKDKTVAALGKPPAKPAGPEKTVYTIQGKKYQADAKDVKEANKKVSKKLLKAAGFASDQVSDLIKQHNEITGSWGNGAPFIRAALRLSGNGKLMAKSADALKQAKSEIKKLQSQANSTDAATLKKATDQRIVVQQSLNRAGGAFNQMIQTAGSSMDVWIDVLEFTRDGSFVAIEIYLAAVTRNPPAAGAAVGAFKQGVEELANAAFFNEKWKASGGVAGSACRMSVKGAEGYVFGKVGGWLVGKAAPFGDEVSRWAVKNGVVMKVFKSNPAIIKTHILNKYSTQLMLEYPKLVQKDIADYMIEEALGAAWTASTPMITKFFDKWLKDYQNKLCDFVVNSEQDLNKAMKQAEAEAKNQKVLEPLVIDVMTQKKDMIAKQVVAKMKAQAKKK